MAEGWTWETLEGRCRECRRCSLCETRHHVVFGVGNRQAEILLVGEGPGENEDLQGVPFVGRAGQLLDAVLEATGFSRGHNVYIANMVKCRPPKNRDPLPEEQEACGEWLQAQIELLRPKILVCLGRVAACSLLDPNFKVTREHGRFVEKDGRWIMGTFHPAAILRNPGQKAAWFADFVALREFFPRVCEHTQSVYPE